MSSKRKYPGNPNYGNYTPPTPDAEHEAKVAKIKLIVGILAAVAGLLIGLFVLN